MLCYMYGETKTPITTYLLLLDGLVHKERSTESCLLCDLGRGEITQALIKQKTHLFGLDSVCEFGRESNMCD